jgi:SPASM domain peptide maturase of grasp-with-spasm system
MSGSPKKWFSLFASCVIVEGKASSLIYDVERMEFYDLANDFVDILRLAEHHDMDAIKAQYDHEQDDLIDDFFMKFVGTEIGFFTTEPGCFPLIDFKWESPGFITNAIIEVDEASDFDFEDVVNQLSDLGCRAVQLRFLHNAAEHELRHKLSLFDGSRIQQVDLLIPYRGQTNHETLHDLAGRHPRANRFLIYAAPKDEIVSHDHESLDKVIVYLTKDLRTDAKEVINPNRFTTNMELFSEALSYNQALNRKVCISRSGEIRNYISHTRSFGNVKADAIRSVVSQDAFREKWYITNDEIEECRDCQYRYACINNSDIAIEDGKYYKTDRCTFHPETNTWV